MRSNKVAQRASPTRAKVMCPPSKPSKGSAPGRQAGQKRLESGAVRWRHRAMTIVLLLCAIQPPALAQSLVPSGQLSCVRTKLGLHQLATSVTASKPESAQGPMVVLPQTWVFPTAAEQPTAPAVQTRVSSTAEFLEALDGTADTIVLAYQGQFNFDYQLCQEPGSAVLVMCPNHEKTYGTDKNVGALINRSVKIIGERGPLCERPVVHLKRSDDSAALWVVRGGNVEIRGIHFRGPANTDKNRSSGQPGYSAILAMRPAHPRERLSIIDNEFDEWTMAGVDVLGEHDVRSYAEYLPEWPRPTEADGDFLRIERNYFHHNARENAGYGVAVSGGVHAWILGNLFAFNRHDVSSSGFAYAGYTAKFNYLMEGAYKDNSSTLGHYNQHFDVHGTAPFDNGKTSGYGETAGDRFLIANNTIRGAQTYTVLNTRPAFMLRGKANSWARFDNNVLVHADAGDAITVKVSRSNPEPFAPYNLSQSGNQYRTDNVNRLMTGDFDGDGRADLMLTNGTAWWVSRNFEQPWAFLHASSKLSHELVVADVDGDRIDDVIFKEGASLKYLPRGSGNPTLLATLPPGATDVSMDTVVVHGKKLCLINREQKIYCRKGDSWAGMSDKRVRSLAFDGREAAWITTTSGEIYRNAINSGDSSWQKMRGSDGARIAAGGDQVWLINTAGLIYQWRNLKWVQTPGSSGKDIHVTQDGRVVTLNNTVGLAYRWNGTQWDRLQGDMSKQ